MSKVRKVSLNQHALNRGVGDVLTLRPLYKPFKQLFTHISVGWKKFEEFIDDGDYHQDYVEAMRKRRNGKL